MLNDLDLLNFIKPKPSPYQLICIGNGQDGTYLIPDDLKGIKACFSPGVDNYKFFEDYLANHLHIQSHMCDFSSDVEKFATPLIPKMQTFEKKWLDINPSPNSISLADWIEKYAPQQDEDLMLQMDIEGAEFRNLNSADQAILKRFRIIVIEVHQFERLLDEKDNEVKALMSALSQHFICVHAHPNNCCGEVINTQLNINLPRVIEFTFLRKDRFQGKKRSLIYPILPNPQDITNTAGRPLYLNSTWLFNSKCTLNEEKMAKEIDAYEIKVLKNQVSQLTKQVHQLRIACNNCSQALQNQLDGDHHLTSANDQINLAEGKYYKTNSGESGRIVNQKPFFFHGKFGGTPSITIDLDAVYELTELRIHNRSDGWFDRAELLAFTVHSTPNYDENNLMPICAQQEFLLGRKPAITKFAPIKGRYLSIVNLKPDELHFSYIEIFGV